LINEIGVFDHKLFPRGYGEENHFCMRVIKANRKNLLCPHAYIFHVKTASFKSERSRLIADGQKALLKAFPSYLQKVKRDFNSSSMLEIRSTVDKVFSSFPL